MRAAVIILAAGSGTRVGADRNKVLLPLLGRPIVAWSVRDALASHLVGLVIVVVRPGEEAEVSAALAPHLETGHEGPEVLLVPGGETRHRSEAAALAALAQHPAYAEIEVVAIHDGARPLAGTALLEQVLEAARRAGGAIPVVPLTSVVTRSGRSAPDNLVSVQTPQAFRAEPLTQAYRQSVVDGFETTDTAGCVQRYAEVDVLAVAGGSGNIKVTFPEDLALASELATSEVASGARDWGQEASRSD